MGEEKIKYDELSPGIKDYLSKREIFDQKSLDEFLFPSIDNIRIGKDASEVAIKTYDYIKSNKRIMIWGDEDVDGITSTLVLFKGLKNINADVDFYIPKRGKEGYGLNLEGIKKIKENGFSLIITVDCGISSIEEVKYAKENGIEVIITDHHEPKDILPDTYIINPKLTDIGYRYLAGAGVAFKFYLTIMKNIFNLTPKEVVNVLPEILIYTMLGTISDRVPRISENRTIVVEGEKIIKKSSDTPFSILAREDIETSVRPLLSGREELTLKFLLTENKIEAEDIYSSLKEKAMSYQTRLEANFNMAKNEFMKGNYAVYLENYPVEFLGSTANLGKELTGMPVFVLTKNNNEIVGEGRGPDDFNLLIIFEKTKNYLSSYGGHKPACGFKMKNPEYLPYFLSIANKILKEYKPKIHYDAEIKLEELNNNFLDLIKLMRPFGKGNEEPVFLIKNVFVKREGLKNIVENTGINIRWETTLTKEGIYNIYIQTDGENTFVKRYELPD